MWRREEIRKCVNIHIIDFIVRGPGGEIGKIL
jgi:hypothetical protein